jgi:hypothetical protein
VQLGPELMLLQPRFLLIHFQRTISVIRGFSFPAAVEFAFDLTMNIYYIHIYVYCSVDRSHSDSGGQAFRED